MSGWTVCALLILWLWIVTVTGDNGESSSSEDEIDILAPQLNTSLDVIIVVNPENLENGTATMGLDIVYSQQITVVVVPEVAGEDKEITSTETDGSSEDENQSNWTTETSTSIKYGVTTDQFAIIISSSTNDTSITAATTTTANSTAPANSTTTTSDYQKGSHGRTTSSRQINPASTASLLSKSANDNKENKKSKKTSAEFTDRDQNPPDVTV